MPYSDSTPEHRQWLGALKSSLKDTDGAAESIGAAALATPETKVSFARPSFLPRVVVAHITTPDRWEAFFSIVRSKPQSDVDPAGGSLVAKSFDFGSAEIHRVNSETTLEITGYELAYLRYYMCILRGEAGAFRLLERDILDDARPHLAGLVWIKGDRPLLDVIEPVKFDRISAEGALVFKAWVLYGGGIFLSDLAVSPNGLVEMLSDEPAVGERIDALVE
jgi:hypothetical protein